MKKISKDGLLLCKLQAEAFENSIDKVDRIVFAMDKIKGIVDKA